MKIRTKLLIDIEVKLNDNESTEETLRFMVDEDLSDEGYNVISTKLANDVKTESEPSINYDGLLAGVVDLKCICPGNPGVNCFSGRCNICGLPPKQ